MNKNLFFISFLAFGLILVGCLGQPSQPTAKADKVTVDFLYADWCPHCQRMKPIVTDLIATLPKDKFEVRYWSEEDYKAGGPSAAVFTKYSQNGMFQGYPTFIINDGADYIAGELPADQFKQWICSHYNEKPTGC